MNQDFWPSSGFSELKRDARGWLEPTPGYLRLYLKRPELALVEESCTAETALHEALQADPLQPVAQPQIDAIADDDARANYAMFLAFRDGLLQAGTLEAYYLGLFRSGAVTIPPLFVDLLAQAIVRNILDGHLDPTFARAGEMLFRTQRMATQDGQMLAGDRDVVDLQAETGGMGAIGRLLKQGNVPMPTVNMDVLNEANGLRYWATSEKHHWLLDLAFDKTQHIAYDLAHPRPGLKALAKVLELWVAHLLGVAVSIRPLQKVEDDAWRWHIGLDAQASAILNDLYQEQPVEQARLSRLVSLFRLEFADRREMRADVAGKPVYLGLAMNEDQVLRLKPQNLLINLPLAAAS
jgi:hypothetical protein